MTVSKSERETIIRASAIDTAWDIWSDDRKFATLMVKRGWGEGEDTGYGRRWVVPLKAISVRAQSSVRNPKPRGKRKVKV